MHFDAPHRWDVSPKEAVAIQRELANRLVIEDRLDPVAAVAGVDVGFEQQGRIARAVVAVFSFPALEPLEQHLARLPTPFPYVPGLLSFREIPVILEALAQLEHIPQLLLCDGQGIAHPRRLGVAAHLGLVTDIPSIGVGKSRLTGDFREPGPNRGDSSPLTDQGERIGTVLRTRTKVKPVFVSPGHRVSQESAVEYVLACTPRYRLPEPIRAADKLASRRGKNQR